MISMAFPLGKKLYGQMCIFPFPVKMGGKWIFPSQFVQKREFLLIPAANLTPLHLFCFGKTLVQDEINFSKLMIIPGTEIGHRDPKMPHTKLENK